MNKIGLGFDYSNICKNYNTVYLDRDNDDPETLACMRSVLQWFKPFFSDFMETFGYSIYRMNQNTPLPVSDIVQKRFFFYSLEKEIIAQTFIFQKENVQHSSLSDWASYSEESLLIQNDDEGEGVTFYFNQNSEVHKWLLEKLSDCSLDEVPFNAG